MKPITDHGTRAMYTNGCRCDACCEAKRAYDNAWARAKRNNPLIEPEPVRRHIERLIRLGCTPCKIASVAGVGWNTIDRIRKGNLEHVTRKKAERILAVTPAQCRVSGAIVSGKRAQRQIQKLRREGYPRHWLIRRLGYSHRSTPIRDRMTVQTAKRVDRLFHELTAQSRA